jgi:hypothetical protein
LIFSISRIANAVYLHFQAKFGIAGYR